MRQILQLVSLVVLLGGTAKMSMNSKVKWMLTICVLLSGAIFSNALRAATYYVKPTGNNANSGLSEALAWQTVQKGLATAIAGDTVFIRSGTYNEASPYSGYIGVVNHGFRPTNSGTAGNDIVFKGYPGDALPMILGVNDPTGSETTTIGRMVAELSNTSYIVFDSLHFRYGWRGINAVNTHYITVRYCVIDSLMGTYDNNGAFTSVNSASGTSVTNITIENCDISYVGKGGSYNVLNASGIHFYGTSNVIIRNNNIHHAYMGVFLKHATATYSHDFQIYGNTFHDFYNGVNLGNTDLYANIVVRNNVFYNSLSGACVMLASPGSSASPYFLRNVFIYNNTMDCGGVAGGIAEQQGQIDSIFMFNNIIYNPALNQYDHSGIGFKNEAVTPTNVYEDYNMFYGRTDQLYYEWQGYINYYTIAQWVALNPPGVYAGHGTHTVEANPLFVNAGARNYNLQAGSPALTGGRGGTWPLYMGALAPQGLTVTLNAKPTCLPPGGGTDTLTWTSTNADSVVIRNQATNQRLAGSGPTNGTILITVAVATTYVATAYKSPNTTTSQVTVSVGCLPAPTVTLTANPDTLPSGGGSTTLTWTSTNADSVVIRDQNNTRIVGSVQANGFTTTNLTSTTTYTATAYKVPNTATAQVTVIVSISTSTGGPARTTSLIVSRDSTLDATHRNITLRWTAPGSDGDTGTATAYDMRFDTLLITNDARFNAATQVVGEPIPQTAGSVDSLTVTGLDPMQVYYFALKTRDGVPNWSPMSNVSSSQNRVLTRVPTVSGTYAGYVIAPLTDGVIAPRSDAATWASDQSAQPHWVEVDFGAVRPVRSVQIYWARNSAQSAWMVSQQYTIQSWNGSAFVDVATVNNATATDSLTVTAFPTVSTQRARIYQPVNMGPATYPTIMWMTELKIEYDTIPPQLINNLNAIP